MSDGFEDLRDLYQQVILDHGRHPRHGKRLVKFDATANGNNPMCGDQVQVWVRLEGEEITDVGFEARGCAISIASADLMAETVKGRNAADTKALFAAFHSLASSGECPHCDAAWSKVFDRLMPLGSVHEYPSRLKCAMLPWRAMIAALDGNEETSSE